MTTSADNHAAVLPLPGATGPLTPAPPRPLGWLPGRVPRLALDLALRATAKRLLSGLEDPRDLRQAMEADARLFRHPETARYAPATLPGPAGLIAAQWALAAGTPSDPLAGPVILYLHGGAYIAGSPNTHRHLAAALSGVAGGVALVPDYRLSPEHRLPAALDDADAAWQSLIAAGIAPGKIALAGDSAGGGLAAALLGRLTGRGAALPGAMVLFSPWADLTGTAASLAAHARADAMLPAHRFGDLLGFCLAEGADPADPAHSPIFATYADPPPTMIAVGSHEILTDDAAVLADRLTAAGGRVTLETGYRLPHVWPVFRGWIRAADATVERAGRFIAESCA
ncbi:MAG: alpha/beta hydrolase [Pseudomonadota bacterium]